MILVLWRPGGGCRLVVLLISYRGVIGVSPWFFKINAHVLCANYLRLPYNICILHSRKLFAYYNEILLFSEEGVLAIIVLVTFS